MKKFRFGAIGLLMLCSSGVVFAQDAAPAAKPYCLIPPPPAANQTEASEAREGECQGAGNCAAGSPSCCQYKLALFDGIILTPEQNAKVENLQEKSEKQRAQHKKNLEEARQKEQQKMQKESEEYFKQMKKILTPEQYELFMKNYTELQAKRSAAAASKVKRAAAGEEKPDPCPEGESKVGEIVPGPKPQLRYGN